MSTTDRPETILVVDDSSLCREMIGKSLLAQGMMIVNASDGIEGLARLGDHDISAVVLDNEMPKMGGLTFLKTLRADARWKSLPVLFLTTTAAKDLILEATKFGISGYLLKAKLSMPEVATRLRSALAQAPPAARPALRMPQRVAPDKLSIPNLVSREITLDAISQIGSARTLAGVVEQITALADSPKVTNTDIAAIVKQDPLLCVRVVQLACSAAYGGAKVRIGNVEDAVRTVGLSGVIGLAASMAIFRAVPADQPGDADLLRCWLHALAVASIMGRIVPKSDAVPTGLAHLIGLCHDLPEIILRQRFPSEFAAAVDFAKQSGVPTTELLQHVFGAPYSELFDRLKLPSTIVGPIKEFELSGRIIGKNGALARSLAIANYLAHGILCTPCADNLVSPLLQSECHSALIPATAINLEEIRSESIMSTCMLVNAGPEVDGALSKPLLPRKECKVWYVRHPNFAALDPLEAALAHLCQVESRDHLPQAEELASIKGFVFASPGFSPMAAEAGRLCMQVSKPPPILKLTRAETEEAGSPPAKLDDWHYPISLTNLRTWVAHL